MNKETFFNKLIPTYEAYFDIQNDFILDNFKYKAKADFHSRSEKYMLMKSAQLWAHENHEYTYFFSASSLNLEEFNNLTATTLNHGLTFVKPAKDHMYTYITLIYLADKIDKDVVKALQKCKYHKAYNFSLHGWCDFRVIGIDFEENKVYTNSIAREFSKSFKKILKNP